MTTPIFIYRNAIQEAIEGRGDGAIVAYGTSATVDQTNKQFDLTTINASPDWSEVDNAYRGFILHFTSTDRKYNITAYTASTDVATVWETPNTADTGAWVIRRNCAYYGTTFNALYPTFKMANGRLYDYWEDSSANHSTYLIASMPNALDDGGFERNSLSTYWTTSIDGDGTIALNSSSVIRGSRDCLINMGTTATEGYIQQTGKIDLEAGKTYGIVFMARHSGTGTEQALDVEFYGVGGVGNAMTVTFTEINVADNSTTTKWEPIISDTNAWEEVMFSFADTIKSGEWAIRFSWANAGAREDLYIDEIYVFPVIQPDTFILANSCSMDGFDSGDEVAGLRCNRDLTSFSNTTDREQFINLTNESHQGETPYYKTFTQPTSIYPVFQLFFSNLTSHTHSVGEWCLGEGWSLANYPDTPFTAKSLHIESVQSRARGGPRFSTKLFSQVKFDTTISLVDGTEVDNWLDFVKVCGYGRPFWIYLAANTTLGITAGSHFMSCTSVPTITPDPPIYYTIGLELEEAF